MSDQNDSHRLGARMFLIGGVGFLEAARALLNEHTSGRMMFHPFAFFVNLSYSYEFSLKAFLVHRKWGGNVRTEIGHDLVKACNLAVKLGYIPPADVVATLAILGPLHKDHTIRYLKGVAVDLPDPPTEAFLVAEQHMAAIGNQIPIADLG